MPKISVIMPILNSADYLRECMDSIRNQTMKDIEIISVDAGSTDGTLEILEEYASQDSRIRILKSERKSVGYQYNMGIGAAQGEYIGFVEPDDYIVSNMYEILLGYAEQYEVDWVKSNYACFMDYPGTGRQILPVNDKKYCKTGVVFDPRDCPKQYIREVFICRGIYKTEWLRENAIRLNETKGASFQDTGFILQAFMYAKRALYIDDYLYCYRKDNQGASSHQTNIIQFEMDETKYVADIINRNPKLYERFWSVHFIRSLERFLSAYERVPEISRCTDELLETVQQYRDYLVEEIRANDDFWELCEVQDHFNEIVWLNESLEKFDEEYRRIDKAKEGLLKKGVEKILCYKKVIVFGCGDHGSGIVSLLLRLNRNQILCLSDNDSKKWNQDYMGIKVVSPEKLKVDSETIVLVANKEYFYEIKAQLMRLEIPEKQIWLCPPIMRNRGTSILSEGSILPMK